MKPVAAQLAQLQEPAPRAAVQGAPMRPAAPPPVANRAIGAFIRQLRKLDDTQVGQILRHAREQRVRFGEAAIALKFASSDDVLWALSQQFHYPYAAAGEGAALDDELVAAIDPFSEQAETLRDVRSQLLMGVLAPEQGQRALAVLSPQPGDGKTFFAANLAVVFSQLGGSTLLIDADLRTPRLHALFGIGADSGLSGILAGHSEGDVIHRVAALPSLHVLPVGTLPPNPLELLQRPVFGLLIQELCGKFDHVIVDTSAASHGADARVAAAQCGAALILGRQGRSRMDALQKLVAQVTKSRAKLAGVLMNAH